MTLLRRTIEAFPSGRSTEELLLLAGAEGESDKRLALLSELSEMQLDGSIFLGRDGKWRRLSARQENGTTGASLQDAEGSFELDSELLCAVQGKFSSSTATIPEDKRQSAATLDPKSLLRYWRSALRADPRGAITQSPERHGQAWQLLSGDGGLVSSDLEEISISIDLERIPPEFREALAKRQANETTLAIGWPIAVMRQRGAPVVLPVGLLAASWRRDSGQLRLDVEASDIRVNPDWLKAAARGSGWSEIELSAQFHADGDNGLPASEFRDRLRETVARQVSGKLTGDRLERTLDPSDIHIHDIAGIFLPTDSTFTAGAVRDLDTIGTWPEQTLAGTALAPFLSLPPASDDQAALPLNAGPLNDEQFRAVRHAVEVPLTVVTGPPGTGKSQAIVSMAASMLLQGKSVLVASKNHQALDAVEVRLGALATDVPFMVRTLDPANTIDQGMNDVLKALIHEDTGSGRGPDQNTLADLLAKASARLARLDAQSRHEALSVAIAEVLEEPAPVPDDTETRKNGLLQRLFELLRPRKPARPQSKADRLATLKHERAGIDLEMSPVEMAGEISEALRKILPAVLAVTAQLSADDHEALSAAQDTMEFEGGPSGTVSGEVATMVTAHRPLWLASVLGTPRRIPLVPALFDLVIFDEASQCDIASALPLLARAKRAVVVGDNKQLSFIPQIGRKQDINLIEAQGLDPALVSGRAQSLRSLFDCAHRLPGAERVMLRHQYRSAADIVDYISDAFYKKGLITAHGFGDLKPPQGQSAGLAWTHVPAPQWDGSSNVNRAEVDAIARHVEELLVKLDYEGSIGVTTPFRSQADAIVAAVQNRVPSERLDRAEFKSATVDSFQGQERDVILFSPCLGRSSRMSAVSFVQKDKRRLNVGISRARAVAHVFGDLGFARSGKVTELQRLAGRATEPRGRKTETPFDSEWERVLFHALEARGLKPKPQYEIMGRRLDLALFSGNEIKLDVEVDGRHWHMDTDGNRKLPDLWRDHQLQSAGWRVRRFWVDELESDMEACLDLVERDLSR